MQCRLLSLFALAALAVPSASFAIECHAVERKEFHGEGLAREERCVPRKAQECGPGRKFQVTRRVPQLQGFCQDDPNAPKGKCAAGEIAESKRYRDYCRPGPGSGGKCGKGRKNESAHWDPDLIVCVDDKNAHAEQHESLNCHSNERPYYPANKSIKPYCEAVNGRCGSLRTAVNEVPGHQRCIDR